MRKAMEEGVVRRDVKSLTSFRFLAAFYVFLFHIQIRYPVFGDGILGGFIGEGAIGMTMFFTLSGFILSHAYDTAHIDIKAFFWNRVARVYPIYIIAALLALPWLGKELLQEAQAEGLIYAAFSASILLIFGVMLLQAWLPQTFGFWNNSASWSISCEAFFYALFPFMAKGIKTLRVKSLLILFATLCLISTLVPVSSIVFSSAPESFPLYYATPIFRLPEFISGMIAYRFARVMTLSVGMRNIMIGTVVLGLLYAVFVGPALPGYTLGNWIIIPSVCAALIMLFILETNGGAFMTGSMFVWLGQISYCFYSFQFHVLEGMRWLLPNQGDGGLLYFGLSLAVLVVVSALAHHFIEEPVRLAMRRRTSQPVIRSEVVI